MADYIDRDKVLDAILALPPKMDEQGYGWLGRMGVWQMLSDFQSADVAPVVHGEWNHGYCSKCGYYWGNDAPIASVPNYCPHCGAKMDLLN